MLLVAFMAALIPALTAAMSSAGTAAAAGSAGALGGAVGGGAAAGAAGGAGAAGLMSAASQLGAGTATGALGSATPAIAAQTAAPGFGQALGNAAMNMGEEAVGRMKLEDFDHKKFMDNTGLQQQVADLTSNQQQPFAPHPRHSQEARINQLLQNLI